MDQILPLGVWHYVAGGALIGVGVALIYTLTGRIAGVSGFLTAAQSWWSRRACFRAPHILEERRWKGVLLAGLVVGAAAYTFAGGALFVTEVASWRLFVGGLFVGFGTRLGRGCTSGHGICGVSALAPPSLVSTAVFMTVAFVTAAIVARLGVTP